MYKLTDADRTVLENCADSLSHIMNDYAVEMLEPLALAMCGLTADEFQSLNEYSLQYRLYYATLALLVDKVAAMAIAKANY